MRAVAFRNQNGGRLASKPTQVLNGAKNGLLRDVLSVLFLA
jgi:hypothetical protein